jgi:hypothetical protein
MPAGRIAHQIPQMPHPLAKPPEKPAAMAHAPEAKLAARMEEVRSAHVPQLLEVLGPWLGAGNTDEVNECIALCLLGAVSETGADFSFMSSDAMPFGVHGALACRVLLTMDVACFEVLRQCQNKMNDSPAGAPFESVTLPMRVSELFRSDGVPKRTQNLVDNLGKIGVRQLRMPVLENGRMRLPPFAGISNLDLSSQPDERWSVRVPPGIEVRHNGNIVPADRVLRSDDGSLVVRSHPEPVGAFSAGAPINEAADIGSGLEYQQAISQLADELNKLKIPGLAGNERRCAGRLLSADGDFSFMKRGVMPPIAVLTHMNDACWNVLAQHHKRKHGTPLESVVLPAGVTTLFLQGGKAGDAASAVEMFGRLHRIGVNDVTMRMGNQKFDRGVFDFRALSAPLVLKVTCSPDRVHSSWRMDVSEGVAVMADGGEHVSHNQVRLWRGESRVGSAFLDEMPIAKPRQAPPLVQHKPLQEVPNPQPHAGHVQLLAAALSWHVKNGIGVLPQTLEYKAQLLLNWVGPHLDLKTPPEELRGILEIMTPQLLNALREIAKVKDPHGIGIRELTLSPSMSRVLLVQPAGEGSALPPLSNWLTEELNKMSGLTRVGLDLPTDANLVTDVRALVQHRGQLSLHIDCPPILPELLHMPAGGEIVLSSDRPGEVLAPVGLDRGPIHLHYPPVEVLMPPLTRDLYVPAGISLTLSSNYSEQQLVKAHVWGAGKLVQQVIVPVSIVGDGRAS